MSCSNSNTFTVEASPYVVRVGIVEDEGDDCSLLFGLADDAKPRNSGESLGRVDQKLVFIGRDLVHADRFEIVDGGSEADNRGDVWSACFEFVWDGSEGRALEGHTFNHVAAT